MSSRLSQDLPRAADRWELSVTHAGGGLVVGTVGPVCLAIWRTKPTAELFAVQLRALTSAVANNPGSAAFLCVVEAGAEPPDQDVRDASAAMISSFGNRLGACACVIEGTGFRAAITRTVLAGMAFVARNAAPNRFFESVSSASAWLCERLGPGRAPGLLERVELARRQLAPVPPERR